MLTIITPQITQEEAEFQSFGFYSRSHNLQFMTLGLTLRTP